MARSTLRTWMRKMFKSSLYNQDTFYRSFICDLLRARREVIIESPFITQKRINTLLPVFAKLSKRGVKIIINTRDPVEHDGIYRDQALDAVLAMQESGIKVLYTIGHHRKVAIIDSNVIYEGSLNILSFNDSCEIMRRIESPVVAITLIDFIGLTKYVGHK